MFLLEIFNPASGAIFLYWFETLQFFILIYFIVLNSIYIFLMLYAFTVIFARQYKIEAEHLDMLLKSEELPSLSIIIPAYNEAATIVFCVETLLNLSYRHKELIVVNDGSTDATLDILKSVFHLDRVHTCYEEPIPTKLVLSYYVSKIYPSLKVVNKINGGKADALNAGVNACQTDYFISIDTDTLIQDHEMNQMIRWMFTQADIKASGASVRVANSCIVQLRGIEKVIFPKELLPGIQAIEYLRAFLVGRMGWDCIGGSLIISGAFSFFDTKAIKEIKGMDTHSVGEDMEITVKLKMNLMNRGMNSSTAFIPQPVAWTEVPRHLGVLSRQRTRWHLGLIQILWRYKRLCFNPRYGWMGMLLIPYFVFGEALAPVVECLGYLIVIISLMLGMSSPSFILQFAFLSLGFTAILNLFCVLIEQITFQKYTSRSDILRMVFCCFAENIGYRQLTIWWRLKAFLKILTGSVTWAVVTKEGLKKFD